MTSVTYTKARANLKHYCDAVCADSEPVIVERTRGEDVVIMSRQEYNSLQETAYLLQSPANAARLLSALEEKELIEFDPTDL